MIDLLCFKDFKITSQEILSSFQYWNFRFLSTTRFCDRNAAKELFLSALSKPIGEDFEIRITNQGTCTIRIMQFIADK